MRIKLDENLPRRLADLLREMGHDVHTTQDEGLLGHPDAAIWKAAQAESRFLVTQDMDFSDLREFAPGTHQGVLVVRLRTPSRENLIERVAGLLVREDTRTWSGCFVVATERKVRIRKPSNA